MADWRAINEALVRISQLLQQGDFSAAEALARQLTQAAPQVADAWYALGAVSLRQAANPAAEAALRQAVTLQPSRGAYWSDLSISILRQGNAAEAESAAQTAVALDPAGAGAWLSLANALFAQRRWSEAASAYQESLQRHASNPAAWNNLAAAQQKVGDLSAAQAAYEQSLAIAPGHLGALANYACLLAMRGDEERAKGILIKAMDQSPPLIDAYMLLGFAFFRLGLSEQAADAYRRAVALVPRHREARYNLALALEQTWALPEAEALIREVLADDPNYADAWALLSGIEQAQCRLDEALAALARSLELGPDPQRHSRLLLGMQYVDDAQPLALLAAHREYDRLYARPVFPASPPKLSPSVRERRLKLGLVSADFRQHPTAFLVLPALEHLDKSQCSITCYSEQLYDDEYTHRFRAIADEWRTTIDLTPDEVAAQIRTDQIDILVDLMGHTGKNQLLVFARKPAPIQITWFGYVGTTGLAAMDFLIADRFHVRPGEEQAHAETVLRMPNGYACYQAPANAPPVEPLPALTLPAQTTGTFTFASFNSPAKISRRTLDAWAAVLCRVPNSNLLLKYGALHLPHVARWLRDRFAERGVEPSRILLEGWSRHQELLATYSRVDLALDTQPYSGGLTTCEALWMGVPTVTYPGPTFASRHSVSHLTNAGFEQFIASDSEGFIELAARWATRPDDLAQIRATARERMRESLLCNAPRFAADLLALFQRACEQHQNRHTGSST